MGSVAFEKTWSLNNSLKGIIVSLLKPAKNQTAYLKLGAFGFQGAGKTYTAMEFAIGICKLTKKKKIAFFDTEKGSDFHIARCEKEGLELFVVKSKSFTDLINVIKEVEADPGFGFLVIDSITHVWRELMDSYLKKKIERVQKYSNNQGRKIISNLTMKDWGVLKGEWGTFSEAFVNSKIHIAACGRAGHDYDVSEDEEGKQEIVKAGTKMKAEGEFGYESDLLIEMYRVPLSEVKKDKKAKGFVNRCIILKDRTDQMNAQMLNSPKFKDFEKIIKQLNIGGEHIGTDKTRNSEDLFDDEDRSYAHIQRRRAIAIETLQEALILLGLDGTSKEAKEGRTKLLIETFGTSAKTALEENITIDKLEGGVRQIKAMTVPKTKEETQAAEEAFPQ